MRNKFSEVVSKIGYKDERICVVVADISPAGAMIKFRKKFPKRFVNCGVAEQSMVGIAAGMALRGMRPFCYTIASFSLFRPFEMVRVDLCYQNLPVTIVGMGAGSTYSTLGGTHLTQEDISIARSIPNMNIIAPCDPNELEEAINYCSKKSKNPVYLRIGKVGEKNFTDKKSDKWKFGKIRLIKPGKKICILTFGPITKKAFEVSEMLSKKKIFPQIYSCHTLKPFDSNGLKKIFIKFKKIIIIEDHSEIGGLSQIVKTNAYEARYKGDIVSFSLRDKFIHCYGSQDDLLAKHGIKNKVIYKKIIQTI